MQQVLLIPTMLICRFLLFLIAGLHCNNAIAQHRYTDTIIKYYNSEWNEINPDVSICHYIGIYKKTSDSVWHARDFYADTKTLQMESTYLDDSLKVQHGKTYFYYRDGQIESEGDYFKGKRVGLWKRFARNGRLIDSARYKSSGYPYYKAFRWDTAGNLIFKGEYDIKGTGEGFEIEYYPKGTVSSYGKYSIGYLKDSVWTYYYESGKISAVEEFDSGRFVKAQCYTIEGDIQVECDTGFVFPEYGYDPLYYLYNEFRYHPLMRTFKERNLKGKTEIIVEMTVYRDGKIGAVIESETYPEIKELFPMMMQSLPAWKPAYHKNRPVEWVSKEAIPLDF